MEWQLPIQKLEIGNINIGNPWGRESWKEYVNKPMAPLSYFGTQFRLPFVSLLFPPLPILEYNASTGKIVLDMTETNLASIKLNTFQDTLINAIVYHQYTWFKSNFSRDDIKAGFQQMYQDNKLILHCPAGANSPTAYKGPPVFKNNVWENTISANDLKVGNRIRIAVKIHGISFLNRVEIARNTTNLLADSPIPVEDTVQWSGKSRLQHRIQGIIMQA